MKRPNGVLCPNKLFRMNLIVCLVALTSAASVRAQDNDAIDATTVAGTSLKFTHVGPPTAKNGMAHARFGIPNIDSVLNFNGQYFTEGQDSNGNPQTHWYFNRLRNPRQQAGPTTVITPTVPLLC